MTAEFAISTFVIVATALFFLLPRIMGRFAQNEIPNMIITRGCYTIGFYLMTLNTAVIGEIAKTAGYSTDIIWRYTFILGTVGYLFMATTVLKTLFDVVKLWKANAKAKRGLA